MTRKDTERSRTQEGNESLTFEQALERLEALVEKLEEGAIPLEESLAAYVEGTRLVRHCLACLERAETVIRELTETSEGLELRRSALNRHVEENDEDDEGEDEDEDDQDGRGN
ncbi:MAG TPA: exodeoxyribonuclease VII small subunit [Candidatus Eisenbacteria bacterium]|nr:exodeoxyribonuclease VII small subunit [Candidatus Eisenbacteria bacterium]